MILPELGRQGQEKLKGSGALIVGVGGLGRTTFHCIFRA